MILTNEMLWLILLAINFASILLMYRFFGRQGMFAWICISTIIANLQVLKNVEIFGLTATLGNISYATIFLATDILSENHGQKDAYLATLLGFISMLAITIIMPLAVQFTPAESDWAQPHLKCIFNFIPRLTLASFTAYAISQTLDVFLYGIIHKMLPATKWLWVRNNVATMASQLLDTAIFAFIAFYGVYENNITHVTLNGAVRENSEQNCKCRWCRHFVNPHHSHTTIPPSMYPKQPHSIIGQPWNLRCLG